MGEGSLDIYVTICYVKGTPKLQILLDTLFKGGIFFLWAVINLKEVKGLLAPQ
jgi:hypothetical protein